MRKTATLVTIGFVLALTGCTASPDDAYVTAVREAAPGVFDRGTEAEVIELGHTICDSLDDGTSSFDLAEGFTDIGWTMGEAGTVVVEAATVLCPEHESKVR